MTSIISIVEFVSLAIISIYLFLEIIEIMWLNVVESILSFV